MRKSLRELTDERNGKHFQYIHIKQENIFNSIHPYKTANHEKEATADQLGIENLKKRANEKYHQANWFCYIFDYYIAVKANTSNPRRALPTAHSDIYELRSSN